LVAFSGRQESDDASALTGFLQEYPQSAWRPSLLVAMGGFYKQSGYFSRAIDSWNEVWNIYPMHFKTGPMPTFMKSAK
jgi:hypothetical protein